MSFQCPVPWLALPQQCDVVTTDQLSLLCSGFGGNDLLEVFPFRGTLTLARVIWLLLCLQQLLFTISVVTQIPHTWSLSFEMLISPFKIACLVSYEEGALPSYRYPERKAEEVRETHFLFHSISFPPLGLVPPNTWHWLTLMAWIHSWWEVFLVQETLGPPTFLIFRWNLEHFADSAFEMVHHRTLLLGAATHSPGREKPRSQGLSTAHGRHNLTLWQGFLDSSISLLLPFPLHSVPKSGPSPRVEVSWWSNEHSLMAGGLWVSINERRWSEPLDYFPSCNWHVSHL